MATSRRARMHAGRVIAGSGAYEPSAADGRRRRRRHAPITDQGPRHLPNFNNNGNHFGQIRNGGYEGLDGVLAALQGGFNQQQFQHLQQGRGGEGYAGIGGQHGAFRGLSPYANHFLASLMEKKAAEQQSVEGLQGDELWKTTLMNNLAQQNADANPTYQLHSGVDEQFLTQLLSQGIGGHPSFLRGYNAEGRVNGPAFQRPFMPGRRVGQGREGFGQHMGQGQSLASSGIRRMRPFRPGGVVRRPLR